VSSPRLWWFKAPVDRAPGRLKDVKDAKQVAPDGSTVEARIQKLCEDVADEIKECANTCDTYLKLVGVWSAAFLLTPPLERRFS
jgi:hypothetical protein